jgi:peptidyl-prolyl cis-trans isomerase D
MMLNFMRRKAGTWMVKAILGAIVVVFIFWGVGSWTSQREGRLATVNGEVISLEAYRASYNRLLEQARQSFGSALSDDLLKSLNLKQQALDQLIDRLLLKQAASELKLSVSDDELARAIRGTPAFQTAGAFDSRRYQQVLSLNRMTPETFESEQRDQLLFGKLLRLISEGVKVSDIEVESWYRWNNASVRIDYVLVAPETYKNLSASTEELAQYFENHKDAYKTEPQLQARYVVFKPEDYLGKVTVTADEIRDDYETHPERYVIPKTVEARHILIKVAPDASPEEDAKAREKIEGILKMARGGKDFAELAKQFSEDGTKENGGALGAFRKEAMVKPFADAAFAMKAGEISEPVRTEFGWHLIKVEKVNEGRTRSLEECTEEIRSRIQRERARNLAYDDAEALYDAAYYGANDLSGAAAGRQLTVQTTDFFTRRGPVQGVAQGAQFAQAAFKLVENEISPVQELDTGYYLIQVAARRPSEVPELKAVETQVMNDLIREKQDAQAKKDADALLADVKGGVVFAQAAKKLGLAVNASEPLKRDQSIAELGSEPAVLRAAFELTTENPLGAEPIRTAKGYAVIRLIEKKPPAMDGLEPQRAEIQQRLQQQKKYKAWQVWIEQLRNAATIERNKDVAQI